MSVGSARPGGGRTEGRGGTAGRRKQEGNRYGTQGVWTHGGTFAFVS